MAITATHLLALVLFGLLHLALGFGLGRWLPRRSRSAVRERIEAQRLRGLLDWLSQMAETISDDMDRHQARIAQISRQLGDLDAESQTQLSELVIQLVNDVVQSNEGLKDELVTAQLQLRQQRAEMQSHQEDALTDKLTRLPNRRAFDDDLQRRFASWQRSGIAISLLLIDIDHFKRLNDTHGHLCGDKVLQQVSGTLRAALRAADIVARYGGEEFAAILPGAAGPEAMTAASHVLQAVSQSRYQFEGIELPVTVSIGVATALTDRAPADLIKRADEALYAAKNGGRNCARFHNGDSVQPIVASTPRSDDDQPGQDGQTPQSELDTAVSELRRRIAEIGNR